jgi:site-specific recombinase XerD
MDLRSYSWDTALQEYLLHKRAHYATQTVRYYKIQLSGLARWSERAGIPFDAFGKRHLDRYLVERSQAGTSQTTLHHDALCAKVFFGWCTKNDLLERNPLSEYLVRNAPTPPKHMPGDEEIQALVGAVRDYWNPVKNPKARFQPAATRTFHRERNYAILVGLLDTACRAGEMLAFKVDDYNEPERRITVRTSKGRTARVLPVSDEWAEALESWLKVRAKVMEPVAKADDEGWLFISETGGAVVHRSLHHVLKSFLDFAGVDGKISLHALRRYSINRLAKHNLLAAQAIAGHKDTKTTLIYTKIDPDFVRDIHKEVGVVRGIVSNRNYEKAKRKRLV